jgi:hypothetical protein
MDSAEVAASNGEHQAAEEQGGAVAVAEAPPEESATTETTPVPEPTATECQAAAEAAVAVAVAPVAEEKVGSRDIPDKVEQERREYERKLALRMNELREDVDEMETEKSDLAKKIKGKEEEIERLRKELCGLLLGYSAPTLFDGVGNAAAPAASKDVKDVLTSAAPVANEDWKLVLLTALVEFGAPEKVVAKIAEENQIRTFGEYAEFTAQPGRRLTDLAGVGEATAEKLQDAEMKFWAAHPEYAKPSAAPAPEAPAAPTFDFVSTCPPPLPDQAPAFFERQQYDGKLDDSAMMNQIIAGFHRVLVDELHSGGVAIRQLEKSIVDGKDVNTGKKLSNKKAETYTEEVDELKREATDRLDEYENVFGQPARQALAAHVQRLVDVPAVEIHTPEQVGLTAERILKDEFPHLLVLAKGDTLHEVRLLPVTFNGGKDVTTYVNVGSVVGQDREVRRLARAWTKREWDEAYGGREFDKDDSYAGIAVRCEGATYLLGPREDSVYVKVGQ